MKTIGLIGGMSWESSLEYYRIINREIKEKLGGLNSAQLLMYSVNFAEVENFMQQDKWDKVAAMMVKAGECLKKGGAQFIVICTNTVHLVAGEIEAAVKLPVLHIAEAAGQAVQKRGLKKVALLGTKFTMDKGLYNRLFEENYGIEVLLPDSEQRNMINEIIFKELCLGIYKQESKECYKRIIEEMAVNGAEGVVLACTEIPLLIKQEDVRIPVFDTTLIHARAAAAYALSAN